MLWQPSEDRIKKTRLYHFMCHVDKHYPLKELNYQCLHRFSVEHPDMFWSILLMYYGIKYQGNLEPVNLDYGFDSYSWFPNVSLNFAENLLLYGEDYKVALISLLENGAKQEYTYAELKRSVAGFQQTLKAFVTPGEVVACYMPNIAETVVTMLATTGLGCVFTSTSADFGVDGVIDRFEQSKPVVLVACAGYEYGGKYHDTLEKVAEISRRLKTVKKVVIVDRYNKKPNISDIKHAELWQDFIDHRPCELTFIKRAFSAPLYIMYSSGTTGKPKCIVHSNGGVLLQHLKELGLNTDHNASKNIFFYTTCGWMMWNWLVSGLYFGGTVTLYEGSPAFPSFEAFWTLLRDEQVNIIGTSPKYLKALQESNTDIKELDYHFLESILCTGSPLLPEQYDYVYRDIKENLMLASISGGTDILGCFFLGNPTGPVYRGELQCKGLGMNVVCVDEKGQELAPGEDGELVCKSSFPSRPLYFLNDDDGKSIRDAYFSQYKGVWYHGDYINITEHGGAIIYGRSDATLNPGGVRIGTSEIYRQTELLPYIEDSVCVGKQILGDVCIVLFVKMKAHEVLTEQRIEEIKARIKSGTTPRHVPKFVVSVKDIPYTRSGKKIELVVSRIINGKPITNKEAIANPECLEEYSEMGQLG